MESLVETAQLIAAEPVVSEPIVGELAVGELIVGRKLSAAADSMAGKAATCPMAGEVMPREMTAACPTSVVTPASDMAHPCKVTPVKAAKVTPAKVTPASVAPASVAPAATRG